MIQNYNVKVLFLVLTVNFVYRQLVQTTYRYYYYYIIIINEQINVAFSTKTTRTRNIPKRNKKNEKTTCSVGREKQAVEQRSEPSVRHCEQVRL